MFESDLTLNFVHKNVLGTGVLKHQRSPPVLKLVKSRVGSIQVTTSAEV